MNTIRVLRFRKGQKVRVNYRSWRGSTGVIGKVAKITGWMDGSTYYECLLDKMPSGTFSFRAEDLIPVL